LIKVRQRWGKDGYGGKERDMNEDERKMLKTYRELAPNVKHLVLAYSHGSLACQKRLKMDARKQAQEAEKALGIPAKPEKGRETA
jgi:hypothetical protein